jgi:hypothetical protein
MKHLVTVIWVLLVLGAVVSGCDGTRRYDSRLTAVDSLMRSAPDSALAMVEAISRDSLTSEGDRAYCDLLLTQARYKAYVTATSDSDINRALAWYRAHPADREKLTRAYIYKGAVMEELNHPDSAMLYYKSAEAVADTTDYHTMGYINLRIGELYQSVLYKDSAVVSRMREATRYFEIVNDTNMMIMTIGTQGLYKKVVGKDSAFYYLEKAIKLGKEFDAPNRFFFQSKLAAYYYYDQNYRRAKDLSFDIIANGKNYCEENNYYYYAARSYIKLNRIDSALWIKSMIPPPMDAVDSMNWHLLLGELTQAANDYRSYAYHSREADKSDKRIMKSSFESTLPSTELDFDAQQRENKLEEDHQFKIFLLTLTFLSLAVLLISCGVLILRKINRRYEKQLQDVQEELKELIEETVHKDLVIKSERDEHQRILTQKSHELEESNRRFHKSLSSQVSDIARYRQAALNELHQNIRIKSVSEDGRKRYLPFISLIKDLSEKREILHTPPKMTFWNNLKMSVDGEYNGIASFVEKNYPNLTEKEMHLFLLVCADFPNPIIKLCMGYISDVTVSKNKKRLIREKFGLDVKFDEFIHMYLDGQFVH